MDLLLFFIIIIIINDYLKWNNNYIEFKKYQNKLLCNYLERCVF